VQLSYTVRRPETGKLNNHKKQERSLETANSGKKTGNKRKAKDTNALQPWSNGGVGSGAQKKKKTFRLPVPEKLVVGLK
jgi:hypothetical protein